MKCSQQTEFEFKSWGGARRGAGRKLQAARPSVPHRRRGAISSRHPVHVTLRIAGGLESLRRRRTYARVREGLAAGSSRLGARLVHYAVMANHLHLVLEVEDGTALGAAIKGLCVRVARALNRLWARAGRVFADRYHVHVLKTPREVKHALGYVLRNAVRHGVRCVGVDPYSSGAWFDGWADVVRRSGEFLSSPLPAARTWLLTKGWRRHGLIEVEVRVRQGT